jgi:hypothetical protein
MDDFSTPLLNESIEQSNKLRPHLWTPWNPLQLNLIKHKEQHLGKYLEEGIKRSLSFENGILSLELL